MSVSVTLDRLRDELEQRDLAYLLTVSDDGRPHSVAVTLRWDDDVIVVGAGNRSRDNADSRPMITLMCPPSDVGGYTLIVDATVIGTTGTGTGDNAIRLQPRSAVLHRPASGDAPASSVCEADCQPVFGQTG